jgi:phosphoenolpyruvate-protein phosphotransferase
MLEPLKTLREIFQDAADLQEPRALLELIVERVQQAMTSDVCSVYLLDEQSKVLDLMASRGLDQGAVGEIHMDVGEGLVGYIAQHRSLLNISHAKEHANFKYFPEAGEDQFNGFLGVPIINFRKLIGVIILQKIAAAPFSDEEEAFAITSAAQLAGPLSQWVQLDQENIPEDPVTHVKSNLKFQGVKGAPGVALGKARWISSGHDLETVSERKAENAESELKIYSYALEQAKKEMDASGEMMEASLPKDVLALFGVYKMILEDESLTIEIEQSIAEGWSAATALRNTIQAHARIFEKMEDPYLQAKAEDIRHIGNRIYSHIAGSASSAQLIVNEPTILMGKDISITSIAQVPAKYLVGLICVGGSTLSHIAIFANALGIPAVMGLNDANAAKFDQAETVLDGYRGVVIFHPIDNLREEYRRLVRQEAKLVKGLDNLKQLPATTPDGKRVLLYANTGLQADISPGLLHGAEGVGLYRSEIPFMLHESFPPEEEQVQIYRKTLAAYAPNPVHMRTLDIGGDKNLPYFTISEDNPFLGWRGIRFTLDNTSIFISQIRAMLRAGLETNNLKILLPMVSRLDEIDAFFDILNEVTGQLKESGIDVTKPQVGVMIEVPSAVVMLPEICKKVDFLSVGSNDFTQYLLAVDRNNPMVSDLYSWLNPAVLRSFNMMVDIAKDNNIPISVCGEMAADPGAVILLLGMGMDMLSVSAYNLPKIKWVIRTVTFERARKLWNKALRMRHEDAIKSMLHTELENLGLAGLIRAGA